ncbi:hypothetical protein [Pseudarthrobacter raffinosi]|uniref:hypothetical protein n=1 Tax=Pseudarthrobacter raffinosi TaxID=2953651 RepID=UPI00208FFA6E|nr:hypothetical protein [Pseudarthrobacter sp. MDT3-9]MCO4252160.1 hypothetical protein [Pseudarthrobacter sp. MDT3-9]
MITTPEEGAGVEVPSVEDIVLSHVGQIGALQEGMQALVEMMDDLLAVPPKNKPAPWNWKELTGPDAAKLMEALGAWVDWINERYGVTDNSRILGCWYLHTAVVEELTAAWVAWQAAYYGHKNAVTDAATWHDGTFWPMLERIRSKPWGFSECINEGSHVDHRPSFRPSTDPGFFDFLAELGATAATG